MPKYLQNMQKYIILRSLEESSKIFATLMYYAEQIYFWGALRIKCWYFVKDVCNLCSVWCILYHVCNKDLFVQESPAHKSLMCGSVKVQLQIDLTIHPCFMWRKWECRKISCLRCTFEERLLAHQSLMCGEIETGQSAERLLMPPIVRNTLEKYSWEIQ